MFYFDILVYDFRVKEKNYNYGGKLLLILYWFVCKFYLVRCLGVGGG